MVLAILDYGSTTLAGLPDLQLGKLQSMLNAASTTSRHCSVICTGCRFRSASRFIWLCLPIGANMVWHRLLCQLIFTALRMLIAVGDFDPHWRKHCSFYARDSQQLVTELSQLPLHALGTIYHPASLQHPLSTFRKRLKTELFSRRFLSWLFYMRMHVLFYMPLIYVYFLFKHLCGPPYRALAANLAYVTLICSLTNCMYKPVYNIFLSYNFCYISYLINENEWMNEWMNEW